MGMTVRCPVCSETGGRPVRLGRAHALFRCQQCGVVHSAVDSSDWDAADHYRHYYSASNVGFDQLTDARYRALLKTFERIHRRGRLLDVGCGAGQLLVAAEGCGWSAVGQEVSASGLQWLDSLKSSSGARFELVRDDLLSASLPPASFAAITLIEVLEHLAAPAATLARCWSLLEPGGVLYMTTPNFDSATRRLLGGRWRGLTPDHLCLFNVPSLRRSLLQAGFTPHWVVTRNIDIPEILLKIRPRALAPATARATETFSATRDLRYRIEARPALRAAKALVNAGLRVTRAGDVLDALAVKAERPQG